MNEIQTFLRNFLRLRLVCKSFLEIIDETNKYWTLIYNYIRQILPLQSFLDKKNWFDAAIPFDRLETGKKLRVWIMSLKKDQSETFGSVFHLISIWGNKCSTKLIDTIYDEAFTDLSQQEKQQLKTKANWEQEHNKPLVKKVQEKPLPVNSLTRAFYIYTMYSMHVLDYSHPRDQEKSLEYVLKWRKHCLDSKLCKNQTLVRRYSIDIEIDGNELERTEEKVQQLKVKEQVRIAMLKRRREKKDQQDQKHAEALEELKYTADNWKLRVHEQARIEMLKRREKKDQKDKKKHQRLVEIWEKRGTQKSETLKRNREEQEELIKASMNIHKNIEELESYKKQKIKK